MNGSGRIAGAMPAAVLLLVAVLDLVLGRDQQLIGLLVMIPLIAASVRGRRATAGYGLAALVVGAALGAYDSQFTGDTTAVQLIRLTGIVLATGIAGAVSTARLHRERVLTELSAEAATTQAVVQLAETLQRRLLGDPPAVPGMLVAARYRPASRHAEVGGDWFDAFPGPDGGDTVVIGDVVGHDVQAAATMAQARGMLRGIAQVRPDPSPAGVLEALDRAFAALGMPPATAVVATVLRSGGAGTVTLRWCNAGHPPPVLLRAGGPPELLERTPDLLLGVLPGEPRAEHELVLAPGDAVLLYTDGLVEGRSRPLDEGTAWLLGELRRMGGLPLDELCDELLSRLGSQVDDDVALLAVGLPPAVLPGRPLPE